MSQFTVDPADGASVLANFTSRSGPTQELTVVDDGGTPAIRVTKWWTESGYSYDPAGIVTDFEIVALRRSPGTASNQRAGILGRLSTENALTFYMNCGVEDTLQGLYKHVSEVRSLLGQATPITVANYHWARLRVDGNRIRTKSWPTGVEEPDWQIDITDNSITAAGYVGIGGRTISESFYAWIGIGINGATAPTEPVAAGVTLAAPTDTTTQTQPITFSWEAEAGATAYQLQIATDEAFTTIVHDDDTLTTTSKEVSGLAASTLHYWRVRADI